MSRVAHSVIIYLRHKLSKLALSILGVIIFLATE